jgi:hypothetical protein
MKGFDLELLKEYFGLRIVYRSQMKPTNQARQIIN